MKKFFRKTKNELYPRNNKLAGFSFIEVMFSVALVAIGITAVLQLMAGSLDQTLDSKNQVIATELAQEGIELVRNIRDNNWLASGVDSFSSFPVSSDSNCDIDYSYTYPNSIDCGGKYGLNSQGGFYQSTSGSATFQRRIDIEYDQNPSSKATQATVTSIVIWGGNWPANLSNPDSPGSQCSAATKCAWAQVILTRWGAS